jgi:hypothetical protein
MKFVCLIVMVWVGLEAMIFPPGAAADVSAALLAQENGAAGDNSGEGSGGGSSSGARITPVTQSFTTQGIIMLALIAAALFPLCKSSPRGN